ncbi:MAG: hypothetical protein J6F30_04680 [Cellulosilyticum sp.]|nr:hypothetical protein [Cellulosilyticum sp.]
MTVKQLKNALEKFGDDIEVMTKKTELVGNVAFVNSVRRDSFAMFGVERECVLLTDEAESEE